MKMIRDGLEQHLTKHLEELEKELQRLLDSYICHSTDQYIIVKQHNNLSNNEEVVLFKLLLERKILQAYDAVEERKKELKKLKEKHTELIKWANNWEERTIENLNKSNEYRHAVYDQEYAITKEIKLIQEKISDYEWEWLRNEGNKDD